MTLYCAPGSSISLNTLLLIGETMKVALIRAKRRRTNGTLGLIIEKNTMPTKTPTHELLENVRTKPMNIKMRENAKNNLFLLSNLPWNKRLEQNRIINAKKLPKPFGFLNTIEPNLPEPRYPRLIRQTTDVAMTNNPIKIFMCFSLFTHNKTR